MIKQVGGALVLAVLALSVAQRAFFAPADKAHSAATPPALTSAPVSVSASYLAPQPGQPAAVGCGAQPAFGAAAQLNGASLQAAAWSVFGRAEDGWQVYAPLVAHELGVACPPQSEAFAAALAAWQTSHGLAATGEMDAATLRALDLTWLARRPFVAASAHGRCPDPPLPQDLAPIAPQEGYLTQAARLRPGALAAYRRLVAAAHAESPAIAADPQLLTIFSGYRDPAADAADCAAQQTCGTPARAGTCSAHRTGLAMDLYLGAAPGYRPDSAADANRLFLSRSPAYQWLVANAARFGFVNYPFEPWHWEWIGEPV